MLREWFRFVLDIIVPLALAVLPAAPLLGQKLPATADEKRFSAKAPSTVRFEKLTF